jgi:hypothetical protein
MFNEYVYLSNDKVRQFLPSEQSWWSRIKAKKFGGKAGAAGLEVSLEFEPSEAAASNARLEKIRDHIGEAGRWFEEPGLTPGEWVFFEGRIGYQALDEGAVLFCQSGGLTPSKNRIVLHGSATNLVGTTVTSAASTSIPAGGYSNPGSAASVLEAALGRTDMLEVAERQFWRRFTDNAPKKPFAGQESLSRHVETLFKEVACTDWFHSYSPFLAGCARITAVVEPTSLPFGVVVASPLFARRARP